MFRECLLQLKKSCLFDLEGAVQFQDKNANLLKSFPKRLTNLLTAAAFIIEPIMGRDKAGDMVGKAWDAFSKGKSAVGDNDMPYGTSGD